MRLRPMPVVMISTLTERGAEVTMKALELGRLISWQSLGWFGSGLNDLAEQIVDKIRIAAVAHVRRALFEISRLLLFRCIPWVPPLHLHLPEACSGAFQPRN